MKANYYVQRRNWTGHGNGSVIPYTCITQSPHIPSFNIQARYTYITLNCSTTFSDSINMIKCPIKSHDQIISWKYSKLHTSWSTNSTSEHWDLTQQNKNTYIVYEVLILNDPPPLKKIHRKATKWIIYFSISSTSLHWILLA